MLSQPDHHMFVIDAKTFIQCELGVFDAAFNKGIDNFKNITIAPPPSARENDEIRCVLYRGE